jgi:hypothetical protein
LGVDPNAADLGDGQLDLDLGRVGVELFLVVGAFDELVADLRSFHHSGVAAEDADGVGATSDLDEGLPV